MWGCVAASERTARSDNALLSATPDAENAQESKRRVSDVFSAGVLASSPVVCWLVVDVCVVLCFATCVLYECAYTGAGADVCLCVCMCVIVYVCVCAYVFWCFGVFVFVYVRAV